MSKKPSLSTNELAALRLVASDLPTDAIARRMRRSRDGVAGILKYAMQKLGVSSRWGAVEAAVKCGLLPAHLTETTPNPLTPLECGVLVWLHRGRSVTDAARALRVSRSSLYSALSSALRKLGADTGKEAALAALGLGAISRHGRRAARVPTDALKALKRKVEQSDLTPFELQIVQELRITRDGERLAKKLRLSKDGLKTHFQSISRKLGAKTRLEILENAAERGLIATSGLELRERLRLSPLEEQVMKALARGCSYKQAAKEIGISYRAAQQYAMTAKQVLAASSIPDAVAKYAKAARGTSG